MISGGDHLLFNEWDDYEVDEYDDYNTCDDCDGTGSYWIQDGEPLKWRKQKCICTEPQV